MKICPTCGQKIQSRRSKDISDHFHAHVTQLARETGIDRNEVYMRALIHACEIETEGGAPYPYTIIDDRLYPWRTTNRSNKEMMTAVAAVHQFAAEAGVVLKESDDDL